ncbi:MAG TPA: DUF3014 domain-containing protein [Myxococcales bacterium]|jgi:hypothetical protein
METQREQQQSETSDVSGSRSPRWPWVIVALLAVGGVGFFGYRTWRAQQVQPVAMPTPVAPVEAPKMAEPPPLPPVAQADGMVRESLGGASSSGLWAKWLQTEDLARRFASAVNNVADGESPRLSLGFLAPSAPFKVVTDKKGKSHVDPASYQRYDAVADTFASIDTAFAAKAYRTLSPIFEAAYREIGRPSTTLEPRLSAAFGRLLSTPVPEGDVEVVAPKVVWLYVDPQLEGLSAASKHLLRMGPRNQKLVQGKLAELQTALGLPATAASAAGRPTPTP